MTTFAVSKLQKNAKRRGNNRKFRWQRRCKNRLFGQRHYHHRRHSEIRRIWGGASYDERRSDMYGRQNSFDSKLTNNRIWKESSGSFSEKHRRNGFYD